MYRVSGALRLGRRLCFFLSSRKFHTHSLLTLFRQILIEQSMDQTFAMNDAEESINNLFRTIDKRFFPEQTIRLVSDCIYRCDYCDALEYITEYVDMFDEEEIQLLLQSWTLVRRYHLLKKQEYLEDFERYCGNGQRRGIMAQGSLLSLEEANISLADCERGYSAAKLVAETRCKSSKQNKIKPILPHKQHQAPDIWEHISQYSSSWSSSGILFAS